MTCNICNSKADIDDLSSPYVIHTCSKCGRKINLREPADNGHGIKLEQGDQFVFPDGWLQVAANPLKGKGHLTKYGLEWFAKLTFVEELPNKRDYLEQELEKNALYALDFLRRSELLKDLDLDNKDHAEEVFIRLNSNQTTIDWWAYLFGVFNTIVEDAIRENDAKKLFGNSSFRP